VTAGEAEDGLDEATPAAVPVGVTYPDAPESVISRWETRRDPVPYLRGDALPALDTDLVALAQQIIPEDLPMPHFRMPPYRRKLLKLRHELKGQSELAALNAILIVNLRRRGYPDHAPGLFRRIWQEHGEDLMQRLPGRWLISSIITFGDVGETEAQRRIGLALNVLFSMMKLYEAERVFSGVRGDVPFRRRMARRSPLPLGMQKFSFASGGLDYNLLAPIWKEALAEPVVGPLACHLLDMLNADPSNIFRRVRHMASTQQPQEATEGGDASDGSGTTADPTPIAPVP
jgi:hypothetical protein